MIKYLPKNAFHCITYPTPGSLRAVDCGFFIENLQPKGISLNYLYPFKNSSQMWKKEQLLAANSGNMVRKLTISGNTARMFVIGKDVICRKLTEN